MKRYPFFCMLPSSHAFLPLVATFLHRDSTSKSVNLGTGIEEVAKDHDVFLLDMWGVMHDGSRPYDGVIDTVKKLKDAGKEMIILSNSSKRKENSFKMLSKLGFDPNDFSQVITSGDVSSQSESFPSKPRTCSSPSLRPSQGIISYAGWR